MTRLNLLCIVAMCVLLQAGCASTKSGVLRTSAEFDPVFSACQQAAVETGFGVTASNKSEGFISAQMAVVQGQGTAVVMSIQLKREAGKTQVDVSIVPPPGTAGNIQAYLDKFQAALKKRVPDVEVVGT